MKFKIGDKVKVLYWGNFLSGQKSNIGDILIIDNFDILENRIYDNYITFTNGDRMAYNDKQISIELVKETYTLKECKDQGISIFCETFEQAGKIHQILEGRPLSKNWSYSEIEVRIGEGMKFHFNPSNSEKLAYVNKGLNVNKVIDFEQVKFEDVKKQISWEIKSGFEKAVDAIILTNKTFSVNSTSEKRLKELNVLELFCDPVFEEKKPINIDHKGIHILISDKIVANGTVVDIKELKTLIDSARVVKYVGQFSIWRCESYSQIKSFKLGCTEFTIDELKNVVKQFEEWNS